MAEKMAVAVGEVGEVLTVVLEDNLCHHAIDIPRIRHHSRRRNPHCTCQCSGSSNTSPHSSTKGVILHVQAFVERLMEVAMVASCSPCRHKAVMLL